MMKGYNNVWQFENIQDFIYGEFKSPLADDVLQFWICKLQPYLAMHFFGKKSSLLFIMPFRLYLSHHHRLPKSTLIVAYLQY